MSLLSPEEIPQKPSRVRVSIIERLVASTSFGLASLSGIVGGFMTMQVFVRLSQAEDAGLDAILAALQEINFLVLTLLGFSIVFGIAALIICVIRMFSDTPRSSPPGFLYLIAGILNLVSPAIIAYAWSVVVDVVTARYVGNAREAGEWIAELCVAAIPIGLLAIIILPIFSFVPFSARSGRRLSSIAALALVVIWISAIAIFFLGLEDTMIEHPRRAITRIQ